MSIAAKDGVAYSSIEIVEDKFSDTMHKLQETYQFTLAAMNAIETYLTNLSPLDLSPVFNPPEFLRIALTHGEIPTVPTISFPELNIPNLDIPLPGFSYSDSPYQSDLKDALKSTLTAGVLNGGTGLGAAVEDGIWRREEDRAEQARLDAIDKNAADWAESGFDLPDGTLLASQTSIQTEYLQGRQTSSRDIATKQAEIARQQAEVFLSQSNQLESTMQNKHTADQARALEAAKAEPEVIVRVFEAAVKQAQVQGEIYNAFAAKANAQAQLFKSQIDAFTAEADLSAKEVAASVQLYDSEVKGASAQSEASWRTDSNKVDQIKNYMNLRMEALKSLASLSANLTAALATSVSTSAAISGQEQFSTSESESSTVSVNYSYDGVTQL